MHGHHRQGLLHQLLPRMCGRRSTLSPSLPLRASSSACPPAAPSAYVEIPNMRHNLTALKDVVRFIYDNIQYAEFNTKSDYCQVCGYDGEIIINDDLEWSAPAAATRIRPR